MRNRFFFNTKIILKKLPIFLILLIFSCTTEQFNREKPYALQAESFRQYVHAFNYAKRLSRKGLRPYIVLEESENTGILFKVLIGNMEKLEQATKQKMILTTKNKILHKLKIVNFNQMQNHLQAFDADTFAQNTRTTHLKYLAPKVQHILQALPYHTDYIVKKTDVFFEEGLRKMETNIILKKKQLDLPIGIVQQRLTKKSVVLAEAVYFEPLYKQKITVHAISVRAENNLSAETTKKLVQQILNTRHYIYEEIKPVSYRNLTGHLAIIAPTASQVKRYLILVHEKQQSLYFIQSSDHKSETLNAFASKLHKSKNITQYPNFSLAFSTVPTHSIFTDTLLYFHYAQANRKLGRYAALQHGQITTSCLFYHAQKKDWESKFIFFNHERTAERVFQKIYTPQKGYSKDSIHVQGQTGWLTKALKPQPISAKRQWVAKSICFQKNKVVAIMGNLWTGKCSREELVKRAEIFDLQPYNRSLFFGW